MRILLTGSSGWLGRFLAPRLREEGHDVVGLDVAPGADTDALGSVADRPLIDRLFAERGVDARVLTEHFIFEEALSAQPLRAQANGLLEVYGAFPNQRAPDSTLLIFRVESEEVLRAPDPEHLAH